MPAPVSSPVCLALSRPARGTLSTRSSPPPPLYNPTTTFSSTNNNSEANPFSFSPPAANPKSKPPQILRLLFPFSSILFLSFVFRYSPVRKADSMAVASAPAATFSARPTTGTARGMMLRPCASAAGVSGGGARFRAEATGNGKWWAPLLGWSGQPDYIDDAPPAPPREEEERAAKGHGQRRFGVLTEEKARQLRARMMETESFHDAMYHSAIASRLASAAPDANNNNKP